MIAINQPTIDENMKVTHSYRYVLVQGLIAYRHETHVMVNDDVHQ